MKTWGDQYRLFLIYKDLLVDDTVAGSPLVSKSRTIALHLWAAHPECSPRDFGLDPERLSSLELPPVGTLGQMELFQARHGNPRCERSVPSGAAVWGWWRKPWESHHQILDRLAAAIDGGFYPQVLLYNQYVRRLFHARLFDLYFEPGLTTVVIPEPWTHACPRYYRDRPHLCGAFFVLEIDAKEMDASEIERLFIDSASFDAQEINTFCVIPPPGDVATKFRSMIDRPPTRANLRTVELTMFLLRSVPKRAETTLLFESADTPDEELTAAFSETEWTDLLGVLRKATPTAWARLRNYPEALKALGEKARIECSRLTRFDFELFAAAMASTELASILHNQQLPDGLSELGVKLREWVTEPEERAARISAAEVFKSAWQVARKRFGLAQLQDSYFDALPALEAISNAVKHELGKKFYRDHLSHNVRAALLAAELVSQYYVPSDDGIRRPVVGFFSGLFHDLALPVTAFPDTIGGIADALSKAQGIRALLPAGRPGVPTIIDKAELKKSLSYVAMLSAVRNLGTAFLEESFRPWEGVGRILEKVDTEILLEEMLCATSDEHALVSSALLFDYAVRGVGNAAINDFDTGVRTLLSRLTGPAATTAGREFACILQAMALHDRRAAAEHHGVTEPPIGIPKPLEFGNFALPALVSVADEFQEWGRTLGKLNEIGATDGRVVVERPRIKAEFELAGNSGLFTSVPFSLLEYCLGKTRTVGRFLWESGERVELHLKLLRLQAFEASYLGTGPDCRINFSGAFEQSLFAIDGSQDERRHTVTGSRGSEVFSLGPVSAGRKRDILFLRGKQEVLDRLRHRCSQGLKLQSLEVNEIKVTMRFSDATELSGRPERYHFGQLAETSTPADRLPLKERASVLEIDDVTDDYNANYFGTAVETEPQNSPYGHFLDFDWRFTSRTCRALVEFARARAQERSGEICYLGCPSLAVWHHRLYPAETNWLLLDRGHYAVDQWLGSLIPENRFRPYDVFDVPKTSFRSRFSLVLTDPPWYAPHYEIFCRRADALLAAEGILGVTYYPRSLDEGKYERFQEIIFNGAIRDLRPFGALEIDYLVPEFEKAAFIFRQFEHPSLSIYRPGFMDFYQAPAGRETTISQKPLEREANAGLLLRLEMGQGHHLLARSEADLQTALPTFVKPLRLGIKRLRQIPEDFLAWTTRNLVLRATKETTQWKLDSLGEITAIVQEIEEKGGVPLVVSDETLTE